MHCLAIIPARYGSSRFPGKPLAPLAGKPLIAHVVERCGATAGIDEVIVATDDERVAAAAALAGARPVMTGVDFVSGTDRVAYVAEQLRPDIVVNVQGDEPLIDPNELSAALTSFTTEGVELGTLRAPLRRRADLLDPDVVKVVVDSGGTALYFSRAPIPFVQQSRDAAGEGLDVRPSPIAGEQVSGPHWIHVGVYLYRTPALLRWARMPRSPLEAQEGLEQLRVLEAGERMRTYEVSECPPGVDTPEDLERVRRALGDGAGSSQRTAAGDVSGKDNQP